jgi:hypothetical protein
MKANTANIQKSRIENKNYKKPHPLLDHVISTLNLKNDAALSRLLKVAPPYVSKIRAGVQNTSSSVLIKIHERAGLPFSEIRRLLGVDESADL